MERLDKLIASQGEYSRSEIKKLIKQGRIALEGKTVKSSDIKVEPDADISIDGKSFNYKKRLYIMLNKPRGVVSATEDKLHKTVVELVPDSLKRDGLFPAGRLDGDTTGFVLITDDGELAHRILSPKNHIMKTYHALLERELTRQDIDAFRQGLTLKDGTRCLQAELSPLPDSERQAEIRICEGKYHQVKRMFAATGNRVLELKRVRMGALELDSSLSPGQCRELTPRELELLLEKD